MGMLWDAEVWGPGNPKRAFSHCLLGLYSGTTRGSTLLPTRQRLCPISALSDPQSWDLHFVSKLPFLSPGEDFELRLNLGRCCGKAVGGTCLHLLACRREPMGEGRLQPYWKRLQGLLCN